MCVLVFRGGRRRINRCDRRGQTDTGGRDRRCNVADAGGTGERCAQGMNVVRNIGRLAGGGDCRDGGGAAEYGG